MDTRNPHTGDTGMAREWLRHRLERAVADPRVIEALISVPREQFVDPWMRPHAYDDEAMPIGHGQTISQPSLVARMVEAMRIEPDHTVLDVGTGSGFQAAILSRLAARVVSVEREQELAKEAYGLLERLGYRNVEVHVAGGELGWPRDSPYDSIIVGAAAPSVPGALVGQLKMGGRLVIPVGDREQQVVTVALKTPGGIEVERRDPVRFVPLIGEGAWER